MTLSAWIDRYMNRGRLYRRERSLDQPEHVLSDGLEAAGRLPGLAPAGQPVQNLFDVTVPRATFQYEYQLRDFIGQVTEMKFVYPPGGDSMPTNLFPLAVTNATAAELMLFYQGHLTNSLRITVDESRQQIRCEPTPLEKVKRWVRQKLHL